MPVDILPIQQVRNACSAEKMQEEVAEPGAVVFTFNHSHILSREHHNDNISS